jgi:NitT/TauT family transport system substrate-binding protein
MKKKTTPGAFFLIDKSPTSVRWGSFFPKRCDLQKITFSRQLTALLLCAACVVGFSGETQKPQPPLQTIRFGTLPVIQALPLFVAAEKGFFSASGIKVELESFQSGTEKDVALMSGQIMGYFGDLLTPMVIKANGAPVKIVAQNFNTTDKRRMFAIVAAPGRTAATLTDVAREGIGAGSNTIVEYLTAKLLAARNIPDSNVKMIEIKSIPIRFQMLMSGQVAAAALPEPLVTLAEMKGGRVLMDDAGLNLSPTVLVFEEKMLRDHPDAVRLFLKSVDKAAAFINDHPEEVREIMNRNCRIPEALQKTFAVPSFPKLTRPNPSQWKSVHDWLRQKKIIRNDITYEQIVDDGYLS